MKYYISIHDVAPHNLDTIENIIQLLKSNYKINKLCLLIIPGLNWGEKQVKQLRLWQNGGLEIAAHGWKHKSGEKKSFFHLVHSLIMSSNCAEHLSKNRDSLISLVENSYNWFYINRFYPPTLYVPPAWSLGKLHAVDLLHLPFRNYECTTGLYIDGKYLFLPLIGFEATTHLKAFFLRFFNCLNFLMARFVGIVRIAIHPDDFQLYLAKDANMYLSKAHDTILLHELN